MAHEFEWATRRTGNEGFVLEICTIDGHLEYRKEYGPMPPTTVPAFVKARRRIVALMQGKDGFTSH